MKKLTAYEWLVIALSLVFLSYCALRVLYPGSLSSAWEVRTQRNDPSPTQPAASAVNTDGLLPGEVIDLNRASRSDLLRLPDIGTVRADAILAHRDAHGPFSCVDQLLEVSGIGPVLLEQLRPYICAE